MLWLCLHFPHLPAEALGLDGPFDAVTEQHGARRWLITAAPGVAVGTPLGTALSLQPQLRARPRSVKAERAALRQLAHTCYRYGSPIHIEIRDLAELGRAPQALLWIEIAASLRLFGGYVALRDALCTELAERAYAASLAVAPSRAASALFASLGQPIALRDRAALERRLAPLPVAALPWPRMQLDVFDGMGLRRLGDLFALPRAAFARRFGSATLSALDQLRGRLAEPAEAIVPPPVFHRRFELADEIAQVEALLFPLRRLAFDLQGWLRARDAGVRSVRLVCVHAQRRRTAFTLHFGDAHRDGARLFETLRERLMRAPLAAPVRALELHADETAAADVPQHDLFDDADRGGDWTRAIERITARLGETAVWTPVPHADHRPERAMRRTGDPRDPAAHDRPRPLWLLKKPVPLPVRPPAAGTPERIESGWWSGGDRRRDYYVVEWQRARAWVFCERDSESWFLHGLWA
ncbi:MAG TPA: DNA polymerase Y family protein [Solimonas sp.]|nr:DNA polymerase Y family protein [Solimonas sp.]